MSDDKRFRAIINYQSFALMILVIFVHAFNMEYAGNLLTGINFFTGKTAALMAEARAFGAGQGAVTAACVENIFSELLGQAAVPGFFMVSALLFYRNIGVRLTFSVLREKWKRRVRSLLIPYFLWNLFYLILHGVADKTGFNTDFEDVFFALVNHRYNPVFWYMKELILLTVLAPFVYIAVRDKRVGALMLFLSLMAAAFWTRIPYHIVNEDALFYYLAGAYCSIHLKGFLGKDGAGDGENRKKDLLKAALFFIGAAVTELFVFLITEGRIGLTGAADSLSAELVTGLSVLVRSFMPAGLYFLISGFVRGDRTVPEYMKINFFVYALHYMIIRGIYRVADMLFHGSLETEALLCLYFFMPAVCVLSAFIVSRPLKKYTPRFWSLINGGR